MVTGEGLTWLQHERRKLLSQVEPCDASSQGALAVTHLVCRRGPQPGADAINGALNIFWQLAGLESVSQEYTAYSQDQVYICTTTSQYLEPARIDTDLPVLAAQAQSYSCGMHDI